MKVLKVLFSIFGAGFFLAGAWTVLVNLQYLYAFHNDLDMGLIALDANEFKIIQTIRLKIEKHASVTLIEAHGRRIGMLGEKNKKTTYLLRSSKLDERVAAESGERVEVYEVVKHPAIRFGGFAFCGIIVMALALLILASVWFPKAMQAWEMY